MSATGEQNQNFTTRLNLLAQAALQYARARVDLLQRELQQERTRVLGIIARAAIFAVGVVLTYMMIAIFVLVAFWETAYRLHAAGALVLVTAGITFGAWRTMRSGGAAAGQPFAISIAEIDKDRVVMERLADLADTSKPARPKPAPAPQPRTAEPARPAAPAAAGGPASAVPVAGTARPPQQA